VGSSQHFNSFHARLKNSEVPVEAIVRIVRPAYKKKFLRQVRKDNRIRIKVGEHDNLLYARWNEDNSGRIWKARQFCKGGPVMRLRHLADNKLKETYIAYILHETLKALEHLHKFGVHHTGVKPTNILLTEQFDVKLTDPWVRVPMKHKQYRRQGRGRKTMVEFYNPLWMPPEGFKAGVDSKGDIWSLGLCALQLATGEVPDQGKPIYQIAWARVKNPAPRLRDTKKHIWSKEFKSFVGECLTKDPEKRPTASELLRHSFMDTGTWSSIAGVTSVKKYRTPSYMVQNPLMSAKRNSRSALTKEKDMICSIIKAKYASMKGDDKLVEVEEEVKERRRLRRGGLEIDTVSESIVCLEHLMPKFPEGKYSMPRQTVYPGIKEKYGGSEDMKGDMKIERKNNIISQELVQLRSDESSEASPQQSQDDLKMMFRPIDEEQPKEACDNMMEEDGNSTMGTKPKIEVKRKWSNKKAVVIALPGEKNNFDQIDTHSTRDIKDKKKKYTARASLQLDEATAYDSSEATTTVSKIGSEKKNKRQGSGETPKQRKPGRKKPMIFPPPSPDSEVLLNSLVNREPKKRLTKKDGEKSYSRLSDGSLFDSDNEIPTRFSPRQLRSPRSRSRSKTFNKS